MGPITAVGFYMRKPSTSTRHDTSEEELSRQLENWEHDVNRALGNPLCERAPRRRK